MVAVTTISQRLATKPDVGTLDGYIDFPVTANNYATVPRAAIPADPALDWRADIVRPPDPDATNNFRMATSGAAANLLGLFSFHSAGVVYHYARLWDSANGLIQTGYPYTGANMVGFPAIGERVHWRGVWDPTTDTLSVYWRAAGLDLADNTGWTLAIATAAPGKQASQTATAVFLSTPGATQTLSSRLYRYLLITNGVIEIDVDPPYDLGVDSNATSFEARTGQTVTVFRSGSPSTLLVPSTRKDRGRPVGVGDWRLVYERLDGTGSLVGEPTEVGTALVGSLQWNDITGLVRGVETRRGADEPNGPARVGEYTMTLDNEAGDFDPWRHYGPTRPGVIMRCGLASLVDLRAGGWLPRWAGLVDDWPVEYEGARVDDAADSWVTVTLVDTISEAGTFDDNALAGVVGNGDRVTARASRLLDAMAWRYGMVTSFDDDVEPDYTLQSTDMSMNRAAELALVADSTGTVIRSDVTGACLVTTRSNRLRQTRLEEFSSFTFGPTWGMLVLTGEHAALGNLIHVGYEADSVITGNNRDGIYTRHRWARSGGVMQTFEHKVAMGYFRSRSTSTRTNLFNTADAAVLELAQAANDREARTALRVDAVTIDVDDPVILLAVAAADLGDEIWLFPPAAVGFDGTGIGRIRSIADRIIPQNADVVDWKITISIDFVQFNDMPGALLDPAPR